MKRATAPSYDLFKLVVTVVLILILLLMLLRGCATLSAAPAPTENPLLNAPAASDTAAPLATETEFAPAVTETEALPPSSTPESIAPSSTPTVAVTATLIPEEPTATAAPTESSTAETAATEAATATPAAEQDASCNTIRPSRLSVGETARVVQRLNMRRDASITAPVLRTNAVNTQVEIIGGPVCTPMGERAYLWWQIRLADGTEGWSAETPLNDATYLLEPIQ